nr:porin [Azospirillum sp. TSO35-2]
MAVFSAGGASADILYNQAGVSNQKHFLAVDGSWGELEIGQTDGARSRLVAPGAQPLTAAGGRTAKLTYYTPMLRGFEIGASYTPLPRGNGEVPDPREALHMVEAAVRQTTRVGGVSARLTAGTSRARVRDWSRRLPRESWIVGTQLAWRSVTLDGDLRRQEEADGVSVRSWNAAVAYARGAMTLSLRLRRAAPDGAAPTDRYLADLSYQVTPRWELVADTNLETGPESAGAVMKLGARMTF